MASTALPSCSGLSRAGRAHQPVRRSLVFPRKPTCRRRRAGSARAAQDAPPVVRVAVGAVTELLRALSPNKKQPRGSVQREEELDPPPCGSVEDVLAVLEDDYRRAYFLTGRSRYSQNLDLLVPFFDSPSLELENIEKVVRHSESWDVSALEAIGQLFVSAPEQRE
nr:unnamed protein product [Digitaria exilis]